MLCRQSLTNEIEEEKLKNEPQPVWIPTDSEHSSGI